MWEGMASEAAWSRATAVIWMRPERGTSAQCRRVCHRLLIAHKTASTRTSKQHGPLGLLWSHMHSNEPTSLTQAPRVQQLAHNQPVKLVNPGIPCICRELRLVGRPSPDQPAYTQVMDAQRHLWEDYTGLGAMFGKLRVCRKAPGHWEMPPSAKRMWRFEDLEQQTEHASRDTEGGP